jgi:hypothetical protein
MLLAASLAPPFVEWICERLAFRSSFGNLTLPVLQVHLPTHTFSSTQRSIRHSPATPPITRLS